MQLPVAVLFTLPAIGARLAAAAPLAPSCTTCRGPAFSWDTVPVSIHTAQRGTGPDGAFSAEDIETIAKFPLATMEKWQGDQATDAADNPVFLWEEDAWLTAARAIKAKSPATSIVAWMDTILVYTGWNVDPKNMTVNTTLNPDADEQCATGHFRPAEYLEREGSHLLLRNKTGGLALTGYGHCHVYDHGQAAAREFWTKTCLDMTATGVIDGCGADFSAMGANNWAAHTPSKIAVDFGLDTATAKAWAAGHRDMMKATQAALGKGLLVGKDGAELGDHVNAVIQENACYLRNSTVNLLRALTLRARAAGAAAKPWVFQCHAQPHDYVSGNGTLAAFLAGAGEGHFFTMGGWDNGVVGHWSDDFTRPLGPPLADATYNGTSWHREFMSGTKVVFTPHINAAGQDMGGTGSVEWGQKPV